MKNTLFNIVLAVLILSQILAIFRGGEVLLHVLVICIVLITFFYRLYVRRSAQ